MPQKQWAVGEEVLAADFNTYLQNQCVPQFTGTAQRDTQWAAPPTGALCVTTDTNTLWQRGATAWFKPYAEVGYQQTAADITGITNVRVTICTTTFTLAAQRRLVIAANFFVYKGGADTAAIAVAEIDIDGTIRVARSANVSQSQNVPVTLGVSYTLPAGSHTVKSQAYNTASFLNVGSTATLSVLDAGAP